LKIYRGIKYILCQKGFEPAEKLAKEKGWPIISSFGSVALTALTMVIEKGFKEIVFIGQDLCYKDNLMHAKETATQLAIDNKERIKGLDIFGNTVSIPANLAVFKSQIEDVIANNPNIRFLNATEGGLHITGAKDCKLRDVLENRCSF
jgi:hypothetical protein